MQIFSLDWSRPPRVHLPLLQGVAQVVALLFATLLVGACGMGNQSGNTNNVQITLAPMADSADGDVLAVQLRDAAGQPIQDATVKLEGNMNHAGMAPVFSDAVQDDADGAADGLYHVPFTFSMLGDWIVTVSAELANGETVTQDIDLTVGESGITMPEGAMDHSTMDHSAMDHEMADSGTMAGATTGAEAQTGDLVIQKLTVHAALMAGGNGAMYFTIMNQGATEDRLVAVASDVAESTELHETVNDNNVMRMEPRPDGFAIPAGGMLELAPGGKHVMLVNMAEIPEAGAEVAVTFTFDHAPAVTVMAPVIAMGAMGQ
ncbi:MAG: copper chaperone PCu(A)C [Caldilineaceae bacterium]